MKPARDVLIEALGNVDRAFHRGQPQRLAGVVDGAIEALHAAGYEIVPMEEAGPGEPAGESR